jgi:hypothetical protein
MFLPSVSIKASLDSGKAYIWSHDIDVCNFNIQEKYKKRFVDVFMISTHQTSMSTYNGLQKEKQKHISQTQCCCYVST